MTWRRRNRYVLERSDGARVVACMVHPHGWRFVAWRAGARAIDGPVGVYDDVDSAKGALD